MRIFTTCLLALLLASTGAGVEEGASRWLQDFGVLQTVSYANSPAMDELHSFLCVSRPHLSSLSAARWWGVAKQAHSVNCNKAPNEGRGQNAYAGVGSKNSANIDLQYHATDFGPW